MELRRRPRVAALVPVLLAATTVALQVFASQPWGSGVEPLTGAHFITTLSLTVMPYIVIAIALIFGQENAWVWWPALFYGVVSGAASVAMNIAVLFPDGPAASLVFLWLPIYQLLGIFPVAVAVILVKLARDRRRAPGADGPHGVGGPLGV